MLAFVVILIAVIGLFVAPSFCYWVVYSEHTRIKAFVVALAWTLGFMRDK